MIVEFGDIDSNGYLDRIFVHKDFQQQGIASKICNELEQYAKDKGLLFITTEVSITAKPFFQKYGYQILKEQQIDRNGQFLTNYLMRKKLIK
ncbi:MAG: GNAT family N-acetyltransferase [Neobacillus sp.]